MKIRRILAVPGAAAVIVVFAAGPALAGPPDVGQVPAGGECTAQLAAAHAVGHHKGDTYQCRAAVDAQGRPCWLWKYAGPTAGTWSGSPAQCHCTPSPKVDASASPRTSPTASPVASDVVVGNGGQAHAGYGSGGPTWPSSAPASGPVGHELPVTGPEAATAAGGGVLLILAGWGLIRLARRRTA